MQKNQMISDSSYSNNGLIIIASKLLGPMSQLSLKQLNELGVYLPRSIVVTKWNWAF